MEELGGSFKIMRNIKNNKRTLFLGPGFSEKDADRIIQELFALNKTEGKIFLQISSAGGNLPAALKLYDNILASPNPVWGIVLGDCFSGATVVLQACTKKYASPHSRLHIHHVYSPVTLTLRHFDSVRTVNKKIREEIALVKANDGRVIDIFVERTKKERSEVVQIMDKNLILTPEQAAKIYLIDEIISFKP
jgi:ATP-dependent protease ClpP protease subunit